MVTDLNSTCGTFTAAGPYIAPNTPDQIHFIDERADAISDVRFSDPVSSDARTAKLSVRTEVLLAERNRTCKLEQ